MSAISSASSPPPTVPRRSPAPGCWGCCGEPVPFSRPPLRLPANAAAAGAVLRGKRFLRRAHAYMEQCVDRLEVFIDEAGLDCAKVRPGFLRVATTPAYVKRLQKQLALMSSLGFGGIEWIDANATRKMVNS